MRFLDNTKTFAKTAKFWSQNVQLVPIEKKNTHTLWFHPQIKESLTLLRDKIAVQSPSFAMFFFARDSFCTIILAGNSKKKCYFQVYGNFEWEFSVRYNNRS